MTRKFGLNKYGKSERAKEIRKLDAALSQLVRTRDRPCITCGEGDVPLDAGHFRRRECMATRFDSRSVAGRCKKENRFEGGKPYEFRLAIDKKFGRGTAAKLFKLSKTTTQWGIGELKQPTSAA
jgi:Bacteriophage Lambda NinG protein